VIWCFRAPFWNRTVEPYFGNVRKAEPDQGSFLSMRVVKCCESQPSTYRKKYTALRLDHFR
jgi:hypothetical protein